MSYKIPTIDFMKQSRFWAAVSIFVFLLSVGSLAVKQLSLGLDFTGGVLVEVSYPSPVKLEPIRQSLHEGGFEDAIVQYFGKSTDVLVRLPPLAATEKEQLGDRLLSRLQQNTAETGEIGLKLKRIEFVGPQVGEDLRDKSGLAMLISLGCILLYISLRFKLKFAIGAVVALFHDAIAVIGVFSLFEIQFDLTVLAAVLAVIGYSINDTIVVFDRVRENFKTQRSGTPVEIINLSLNQTLSRTIITSFTTLLVLIALLAVGGELIFGFALALTIGIIAGTYSTIYVASSILLALNISKEDFIEKTPEELDDLP